MAGVMLLESAPPSMQAVTRESEGWTQRRAVCCMDWGARKQAHGHPHYMTDQMSVTQPRSPHGCHRQTWINRHLPLGPAAPLQRIASLNMPI